MLRILSQGSLLGQLKNNSRLLKRFFLSDAYKCTEAWENRLKAPVLEKVQLGNLYAELDKNFSIGRFVNVVDIDIFINGAIQESLQNEVEDVLYKLRASPETSVMFESTSHAVIRSYISWNKKEDLLNILGQRLVFGIFPDIYLAIFMIDAFLNEKDFISAVKIAVLQMLQEDCNHPILNVLSLYSCIKYMNSPDIWEVPKEVIDEDEEVVKYRVDYIRNEYNDDHFDITDTNHFVGKTMIAFGKTVEGPIGISCQLIGLVLHEKFDQVKALVLDVLNNNVQIHKEAVETAISYLQNKPKQESHPIENKEGGEGDTNGIITEQLPDKIELAKLLDELSNKNLLTESLEAVLEQYVKEEVKEHENNYIMKQCEIYKTWEEMRLKECEEQIKEEERSSVRRKIEEMKKQLEEEEKKLFYYDKEEDLDDTVAKKKIMIENFRYYEPKKKDKMFPQRGYILPHKRKIRPRKFSI